MLDKNELQELLVRLKLGTLSVDSAIEEIEKNFNDENDYITNVWKNSVFENVIFYNGKNFDYIKNAISEYIEKHTSFICVGLENSVISELAAVFDNIEFVYDAGMAYKVYDSINEINFNTVILSPDKSNFKVCREVETTLNLVGIKPEIIFNIYPDKLSTIKKRIVNANCVVIVSHNSTLSDIVSFACDKPIIFIPTSKNKEFSIKRHSLPMGIVAVNVDCGFEGAMAVYRLSIK